ncbi:Flp pilus assembly protein TadG [Granulicella aggregans]|uniref:Flp pilus assembly protein TadG n=1 Tax=Granulicella aggregans TaxID=474949 RepID=A0A7W8E402_9BACT|nr:Flp pilus assembly protein TadG [Granulicella aggregans]
MKRLFRRSDGQTIIEMALVLPVLVMFTFGVLELSIFIACCINGTYAAHAAVRYAIVHGSASTNPCTTSTLQSQVKPFLVGIPSSAVTIAPTWSPNTDAGSTVTVKITFSYPITIPFDKARTLSAVATASGTIVE